MSAWIRQRSRSRYTDLRAFLADLERRGELLCVAEPIDRHLEITALCRKSLRKAGPAFLFNRVLHSQYPVLGNLFSRPERVAAALGLESLDALREVGELLCYLRSPSMPDDPGGIVANLPQLARIGHLRSHRLRDGPCQEQVQEDEEVDLGRLPITTCWPDDAGPLLTFGLVVTRGPAKPRMNVAVYRQQPIDRNKLIMRWLPHRGGAIDYREWCSRWPDRPFPVAVAIGADPATLVAAVSPIPDTLSEYQFAGLLRGAPTELVNCRRHSLAVPATAEFVLEGHIYPGDEADEGPFCDHTGYYNSVARFPVMTVETITARRNPIYHSSYMGKPPEDEPSMLSVALNEMYVPLLSDQFPEIADFYLPPAACSYRVAIVSIRKHYPGHARRIMFGIWSFLRQFTYTKYIIVTDDDIDIRNSDDVLWAVATRADPARDTVLVQNTPIDYLDFASPAAGLGGKLGLDATSKWREESSRSWGRVASMSAAAERRAEEIWRTLGCGE